MNPTIAPYLSATIASAVQSIGAPPFRVISNSLVCVYRGMYSREIDEIEGDLTVEVDFVCEDDPQVTIDDITAELERVRDCRYDPPGAHITLWSVNRSLSNPARFYCVPVEWE